jgi:hypothetical protein
MNEYLKELAIKAGAPVEVLDQMWFNIFCQQFADVLIVEMEQVGD